MRVLASEADYIGDEPSATPASGGRGSRRRRSRSRFTSLHLLSSFSASFRGISSNLLALHIDFRGTLSEKSGETIVKKLGRHRRSITERLRDGVVLSVDTNDHPVPPEEVQW